MFLKLIYFLGILFAAHTFAVPPKVEHYDSRIRNNTLTKRLLQEQSLPIPSGFAPLDASKFTTSCTLPQYVLVPKAGAYSNLFSKYLSNDYVTNPCSGKYFYMTYNAEYLTQKGFNMIITPQLNYKYPSLFTENSMFSNGAGTTMVTYETQDDNQSTLGYAVDSDGICGGQTLGKGITYFIMYDQSGLKSGANGMVHAVIKPDGVPSSFQKEKMYIQFGCNYNPSVVVTNIKMSCLASDSCGVTQDSKPSTNADDVKCFKNPTTIIQPTTVIQPSTAVQTQPLTVQITQATTVIQPTTLTQITSVIQTITQPCSDDKAIKIPDTKCDSSKTNKDYGSQKPIPVPCSGGDFDFTATMSGDSDVFIALVDTDGIESENGFIEVQLGLNSGKNNIKKLLKAQLKRSDISTRADPFKIKISYENKTLTAFINDKQVNTYDTANFNFSSMIITPFSGSTSVTGAQFVCGK